MQQWVTDWMLAASQQTQNITQEYAVNRKDATLSTSRHSRFMRICFSLHVSAKRPRPLTCFAPPTWGINYRGVQNVSVGVVSWQAHASWSRSFYTGYGGWLESGLFSIFLHTSLWMGILTACTPSPVDHGNGIPGFEQNSKVSLRSHENIFSSWKVVTRTGRWGKSPKVDTCFDDICQRWDFPILCVRKVNSPNRDTHSSKNSGSIPTPCHPGKKKLGLDFHFNCRARPPNMYAFARLQKQTDE